MAVPKALFDDLELPGDDARETEADEWAQEALIPRDEWDQGMLRDKPTTLDVVYFANKVGIHPAIVAGRVRYETGNYRRLSQLVGSGKVRRLFEEV